MDDWVSIVYDLEQGDLSSRVWNQKWISTSVKVHSSWIVSFSPYLEVYHCKKTIILWYNQAKQEYLG